MFCNQEELFNKIKTGFKNYAAAMEEPLITEPFYKDFAYRFCWNSNSIEGNTLSLDETIEVIDFDTVRSGHTYSEYTEAKILSCSCRKEECGEMMYSQITQLAEEHISFERMHPFADGNGRTGRLLLNQQLINIGWLPVLISSQSKYRQSFRQYNTKGDVSMMTYLILKGEEKALENIGQLWDKSQR